MNPLYIFDLSESGFTFFGGSALLVIIFGIMLFSSFLWDSKNGKKYKIGLSVGFVLWSIFLIDEVYGYLKYVENIKQLESGSGVSVNCGKIEIISTESIKRIRGNIQKFKVGESEFSFNIQDQAYYYNLPLSKNKFLKTGNYAHVTSLNEQILRIEIYADNNCDRKI